VWPFYRKRFIIIIIIIHQDPGLDVKFTNNAYKKWAPHGRKISSATR
jgi:hypothetical protein